MAFFNMLDAAAETLADAVLPDGSYIARVVRLTLSRSQRLRPMITGELEILGVQASDAEGNTCIRDEHAGHTQNVFWNITPKAKGFIAGQLRACGFDFEWPDALHSLMVDFLNGVESYEMDVPEGAEDPANIQVFEREDGSRFWRQTVYARMAPELPWTLDACRGTVVTMKSVTDPNFPLYPNVTVSAAPGQLQDAVVTQEYPSEAECEAAATDDDIPF